MGGRFQIDSTRSTAASRWNLVDLFAQGGEVAKIAFDDQQDDE
jgi:hypothetical protein